MLHKFSCVYFEAESLSQYKHIHDDVSSPSLWCGILFSNLPSFGEGMCSGKDGGIWELNCLRLRLSQELCE